MVAILGKSNGNLLSPALIKIYNDTLICYGIVYQNVECDITNGIMITLKIYIWNQFPWCLLLKYELYSCGDFVSGVIVWHPRGLCDLGPLLLTWFNFNPSMDK